MSSPTGIGFTLGAIAAIVAFVIALFVILPASRQLAVLGGQIRASGAPPSAEQMSQLQSLQRTIRSWGIALMLLLTIAVVFMAISRYLG
jgi:phosphate/sulfate permease